MVQLQEAVVASRKFLLDVFEAETLQAAITLEGVEPTEDMKFWLVTFSYWSGTTKKYKTVKLRVSDGIPFGVKNPDL